MTWGQYLDMLRRYVNTNSGAIYFALGSIDSILESEVSGAEKIARIKNVIWALEEFNSTVSEG